MSFPNQFQLGNPENEPGKFEIHFGDVRSSNKFDHLESLQRQSSQQKKEKKKAEQSRRGKKEAGKKEAGTSEDHPPHESDGASNEEGGDNPKESNEIIKRND